MKTWATEIHAISPIDGQLKIYAGCEIKAPTKQLAREFCELNGLGYLHISGELIAEIPCKNGTYKPDFDNIINCNMEKINYIAYAGLDVPDVNFQIARKTTVSHQLNESIENFVCVEFGTTIAKIRSKCRDRDNFTTPRQIIIYLYWQKFYKENQKHNFTMYGNIVNRNRTTALYTVKKIQDLMVFDKDLEAKIISYMAQLNIPYHAFEYTEKDIFKPKRYLRKKIKKKNKLK